MSCGSLIRSQKSFTIMPLSLAAGPNLKKEDPHENLQLAMLWSTHGLLALFRQPPHKDAFTRIFNPRKNESTDRQIGERHLAGPSKHLPSGYLLTGTHVPQGALFWAPLQTGKTSTIRWRSLPKGSTECLPFNYDAHTLKPTRA